MSNQRERTKIAKGIYRDKYGISVIVNVGVLRRELRFPLGTDIKRLKAAQDETRVALRKVAPTATRGTFAADAERYLKAVAAMPTYKERDQHIGLWVAEFGQRARHSVEASEIRAVLERWRLGGLAASTVNHRRTALQHLWTVLDGRNAVNPVRDVPKQKEPEPEARALSYEQIEAILDAMPDVGQGLAGQARDDVSKTKIRLRVLAYTGIPAAQLRRLRPKDVNLITGTMLVSARRKGHGSVQRTVPLSDGALQALREFADLDCWGGFSTSSMWKSFQRAAARLNLEGVRPYDLRHSYGTQLYATSGDVRAVQELLLHSAPKTTERYTQGAVPVRQRHAVDSFNAATKIVEVKRGSDGKIVRKTA